MKAGAIGGGMSLKDVVVDKASWKAACVLFNNRSQMTLARNSFCRKQGFPYKCQDYSIIGVRGDAQHYTAGIDGFLWTVPMFITEGKVDSVKEFRVNNILGDPIG